MKSIEILNSEQQIAIHHLEGPLLILAGAGSGKTHVVTSRIIHLIEQGVPSDAILGVTFTNKAAAEMKERVRRRTHHHVQISTFHSLGARLLREFIDVLGYRRDFVIYDVEDAEHVLKSCLHGLEVKDEKAAAKTFKSMISRAKNDLLGPGDIVETPTDSKIERYFPSVYALYQEKLKECHAVDFDDLLFLPVKILKEYEKVRTECRRRWSFLLIDEFQDTNEAQYQLIKILLGETQNLCVVGDPDQSIYSWRGANINNILHFTRDFPNTKVIKLEQNYRSTNTILQASNALIDRNLNRPKKSLWSELGEGQKIQSYHSQSEKQEVQYVVKEIKKHHEEGGIPLHQQVIFYRTNFQSRAFEDELLRQHIPYVIIGGMSFYQRREIKDVLAFLRMAHSNSDLISFVRSVNLPKRGIGDKTIQKIQQAASQAHTPLYTYLHSFVHDQIENPTLSLSKAQKETVKSYVLIIQELKEIAKRGMLQELVKAAVERTGYIGVLALDPESYEDRKANVEELVSKAAEWESGRQGVSLETFLEELSLKSNMEEVDDSTDRLNLMTLHNGKGLEFEVVYLVGMEEGLFPHISSQDSLEELEEERRLCYVGMTRAKRQLYVTMAKYRFLWGTGRSMYPSRFLREIPQEYVRTVQSGNKWSDTSIVDDDFKDEVTEFHEPIESEPLMIGDVIFHKQFGVGTIKGSYQGSLGLTYEIFFTKDNATKSLVAKYAQLS